MNKKLLVFGTLSFAFFFIVSILYLVSINDSTVEMGMSLNVNDDLLVGYVTETDSLKFGDMPRGSITLRPITINSTSANRVIISTEGALGAWASVSDNNFTLYEGYSKKIDVIITIPPDAKVGNYTGTLLIDYETIDRKL